MGTSKLVLMYPMAVMSLKAGMGEYQANSTVTSLMAMDAVIDNICFLGAAMADQVPVLASNTRASTRVDQICKKYLWIYSNMFIPLY